MVTDSTLTMVRNTVLGLTGLVCLGYAIAAIMLGRPDPIPAWIPGAFGVASGVIITFSVYVAGAKATEMSMDEGYIFDAHKAQRVSYWVALALYPIFGIALANGLVVWPVAFAAMGTLTGASFLLLFVLFDLRGRL